MKNLSDSFIIWSLAINTITVIASLGALWISYKTYKRQNTLDNQNKHYDYKLETYNKILIVAHNLLFKFRKEIVEFYTLWTSGQLNDNEFKLKAEKLDLLADEAQEKLYITSAFLPEEIIDKIEEFLDELYGDDLFFNTTDEELNNATDTLVRLDNIILEIADLMRDDLGIDVLNKKLADRIQESDK